MGHKSNSLHFEDLFQQKLEKIKKDKAYKSVKKLIPDPSSDETIRNSIKKELINSFSSFYNVMQEDGAEKINAIFFEFVGDDIEPFIPSACWGSGFSALTYNDGEVKKKGCLFEEVGGFDLELLDPLFSVLEKNGDLLDLQIYEDVRWLLTFKIFQLTAEAIEQTIQHVAFLKLPIATPFYFITTGGHEEDKELLFVIE